MVQNLVLTPSKIIKKPESSLTPWFLQAATIYFQTYGKIPPVFVDLIVLPDSTLLLKAYPLRKSIFRIVWTVGLVSCSLLVAAGLSEILLKRFIYPQNSQLTQIEIVICIGYLSCLVLLYSVLGTCVEHRNNIAMVNDFINNGLHLGKFPT